MYVEHPRVIPDAPTLLFLRSSRSARAAERQFTTATSIMPSAILITVRLVCLTELRR